MSDVDFSFEAKAKRQYTAARFAEDTRRHRIQSTDPNGKRKPKWEVVEGAGEQPALFEVSRNKQGEIVTVAQLRPHPRSAEAENRIKYECLTTADAYLGGREMLRVPAGVLIRCGETIAFGLLNSNTGKILKEVRP